ncbi:hypothetical protein VSDG_01211 [Cytospora chrysosperma]|uniref:Uncharacterized protein n=1 Tax=Cytospora chrysosperma TaxID=252740 RepID=A0A423WIK7_CYTCH|nr:hypothetical protein VSDG_01211 [Valsa sordida]
MRLTAPTSTAHIGQVEIRGVQRVMEFEATENHHRRRQQQQQQQQQHRHAARRGQQPSQAVTPAELDAVQSRTVIVVPCKDEPLDRILSVWAGIPPGSLIMAVSGSAEGAYRAEREALAGFCRDTGRSGMCVWQRDPVLAGALRQVGLTALLDGDDDGDGNWDGDGDAGLVHKGKGEALVIGIALAAVARGPDGRGLTSRRSHSRCSSSNNSSCCSHRECQSRHRFGGERNARVGGQDTKARYDDGGSQQDNDTTTTNTRRGNGREHAGSSPCRGRSRVACQQRDGGNGRRGGIEEEEEEEEREGGEGGDEEEEEEEREDGPNGTRTGFYKYIGFVDADNFVPGSVHEYCKAFSSGLHLASAEDAMVRISWGSKPKVKDGNIEFKKSGRSSEVVNRWFNRLLEEMRGGCAMAGDAAQPLSHICTGNAGEHAMTLSLALKLRLASGYAIEPFHFLDIFERFAGGWGDDDDDNNDSNKAAAAAAAAAASSPPRPASLPELGSSPISSMSSSPLPTPMDCSPVLSASSPSGAPAALEGISALPPLPPPSATVVEATVAAMRAMYSSAAASSSPSSSSPSPSPSPRPSGPAGGGGKVQILQVRTMNPHFHDTSKGESHIAKMWMQGLSAIYHSPVTARLPAYRDALWAAILEGKAKLDGGANSSTAAAAGDWEPERCRIYPAPAGFDLLRLRDILEASEGSYWWSGMDEDDEEDVFDEEEEEEVEDEEDEVDEVPLEDTPNVDFGLDGCPYGMSYRTREAIMEFLHDSSSPSGELQLQLPPADAVQNGAFQGRQDFPLPQRDFGLERAVRSKTPKEQQQGGTNLWYPWFCP